MRKTFKTFLNDTINVVLPRSYLARSVVGLASGTMFGQAIVVLASPILTRIYSPADFGILSLYVATIAVIGVIAGFRYEFGLPIASNDYEAVSLVALGTILTLISSLISGLILLFAWEPIEHAFELESLRYYKWAIPVGIASIGIFNIFTLWGTRERMYGLLARSKLTQGVSIVSTQIGAGLIALGGFGLIVGDILGRLFAAIHIGRRIIRLHFKQLKLLDLPMLMSVLVRFRRFPILSAPASFFNTLGLQLPVVLVAAYYGIDAAGWLMLSQMIVGGPMTLIGQSVSRVYSGELGQRRREYPDTMEALFLKMTIKLATYCTVPILVLAVFAPAMFEWVFGENWYTAGLYTRMLALMLVIQIIVSPVSSTLTLLDRQDIQLMWDISRVILVVAGFRFAATNGLSDLSALATYCWAMIFLYIILWCISLIEIRRFSRNAAK